MCASQTSVQRRPTPFNPAPFPEPRLGRAWTNRRFYVESLAGCRSASKISIDLIPAANPKVAYQKVPRAEETAIRSFYRGTVRAKLYDYIVLKRVSHDTFRKTEQEVKIKYFVGSVADRMRRERCQENAWHEISVAKHHGDGVHIVECIDALKDKSENLYLIMPLYGGGNLHDNIPQGGFLETGDDPRPLILQLGRKVHFIHQEERSLIFRDLSDDQVLLRNRFVNVRDQELPENFAVLTDFAMSVGFPYMEGHPQTIKRQIPCGKLPYMPPEIAREMPFGVKADVWCFGVTHFKVVTGMTLYDKPGDLSYELFVTQGGLLPEKDALLRRIEEDLLILVPPGLPPPKLLGRIQAVLRMPKTLRRLLASVFQEDSEARITLDAYMAHEWFRQARPFQDDDDDDDDDDDRDEGNNGDGDMAT